MKQQYNFVVVIVSVLHTKLQEHLEPADKREESTC